MDYSKPSIFGWIFIVTIGSACLFGFAIWPYTMFLMFKAQKSPQLKSKFDNWMRFYMKVFGCAFVVAAILFALFASKMAKPFI